MDLNCLNNTVVMSNLKWPLLWLLWLGLMQRWARNLLQHKYNPLTSRCRLLIGSLLAARLLIGWFIPRAPGPSWQGVKVMRASARLSHGATELISNHRIKPVFAGIRQELGREKIPCLLTGSESTRACFCHPSQFSIVENYTRTVSDEQYS